MNPGILQNENEDEFGKLVFGQFQTGLKSGNSVQTVLNKIACPTPGAPLTHPAPGQVLSPGPKLLGEGGGSFVFARYCQQHIMCCQQIFGIG